MPCWNRILLMNTQVLHELEHPTWAVTVSSDEPAAREPGGSAGPLFRQREVGAGKAALAHGRSTGRRGAFRHASCVPVSVN